MVGTGKGFVLTMVVIGIAVIALGIFSMDAGTIMNAALIAVLLVFSPVFISKYSQFVWMKALEQQFPNFLRDMADLLRSGMSFQEAVKTVSRGSYGKLTEKIRAMSNRLSWGTPFLRVLEIFGRDVRGSKIITEVLHIIRESYHSGGNVAETLDSVANNIIMLKEVEADRRALVQQQVGIIYGVFFVFVAITVMIIFVLVPMIGGQGFALPAATSATAFTALTLTFTNPCEAVYVFPCPIYSATGMMLGLPEGIGSYYVAMFLLTIVIEGVFMGLIAGQLGSNSLAAGLKHSLIMVLVGMGIFIFLAKTGFFPL